MLFLITDCYVLADAKKIHLCDENGEITEEFDDADTVNAFLASQGLTIAGCLCPEGWSAYVLLPKKGGPPMLGEDLPV